MGRGACGARPVRVNWVQQRVLSTLLLRAVKVVEGLTRRASEREEISGESPGEGDSTSSATQSSG